MIGRPESRPRGARAPRRRDAWIAFADSPGNAVVAPPAETVAGDRYQRWVISYQAGEINALVERLAALERKLRRRSASLTGTLALLALVATAVGGYWAWTLVRPAAPPAVPAPVTAVQLPPAPIPPQVAPAVTAEVPPTPSPAVDRPPAAAPEIRAEGPPISTLPVAAPLQVTVAFPRGDGDALQVARLLAQHLRERDLAVAGPVPSDLHPSGPGITYYFEEDREGALAVERILSGLMGRGRLATPAQGEPTARPGSVTVTVPES